MSTAFNIWLGDFNFDSKSLAYVLSRRGAIYTKSFNKEFIVWYSKNRTITWVSKRMRWIDFILNLKLFILGLRSRERIDNIINIIIPRFQRICFRIENHFELSYIKSVVIADLYEWPIMLCHWKHPLNTTQLKRYRYRAQWCRKQ